MLDARKSMKVQALAVSEFAAVAGFVGGMMADRRSRHGLTVLKARVKVRGLSAIDLRTAAAQALVQWKQELLRDLGGAENVSAQRMTVVEMVVRTKLYIDHVDAWLMEQDSLVNRRKKSLLPVVKERQALVDSLSRLLSQLGLERREKPIKSLQEHLREVEAAKPSTTASSATEAGIEQTIVEPEEIEMQKGQS